MDTYPENRTYGWEAFGAIPVPISGRVPTTWTKLALNAYRAAKNQRQRSTWKDVLDALSDIECEYDIHELTAKKFKQLLIAAAKQNQWMKRQSARTGFTAFVDGQPDMRRCYKCLQVKPRGDFRAVSTEAKKSVYKQSTEERTYYTHTLCSTCRAEKRTASCRKPRALKGVPLMPHTLEKAKLLRARMSVLYGRSSLARKRDADELDQATQFHKLRLLCIDRARSALDGLLLSGGEVPDDWRFLLSKEDRQKLHAWHAEMVLPTWSGKGHTPSCF